MIEQRDNGDLVLFAVAGDPLARLQADGHFLQVNTNGAVGDAYDDHPLNTRAEQLDEEAVVAIRDWCEERLREDFGKETREDDAP